MQPTTKKFIAKEWLTFVILFAAGLTIAPLAIMAVIEKKVQLSMLSGFYGSLFSRHWWALAWLVALAPYITTSSHGRWCGR
jgi:hypothetical protein